MIDWLLDVDNNYVGSKVNIFKLCCFYRHKRRGKIWYKFFLYCSSLLATYKQKSV